MSNIYNFLTFAEKNTDRENNYLKEIREETEKNFSNSHMLSGEYQGRFLSLVSKLHRPKKILEIGTYVGYSALCLAEGLQRNGIIHTIEVDDSLQEIIKKNIQKSIFEKNIKLYFGNAMEIIPNIEDNIDLVFIDANKKANIKYYNLCLEKLSRGGLIITDNVWFKGKVIQEYSDKITRSIQEYINFVLKDKRTESITLPIRDGLLLSLKV